MRIMAIERHPIEGYPVDIAPGQILEGDINGVHHIVICQHDGFALRSVQAQAGQPDIVVPIGEVISLDTGTRLVSTSVAEVEPSVYDYAV